MRPDASATHGVALPQRIRMEGHVRTESVQQLVALSPEMCCAGNGYAWQGVECRGPDCQLNVQDLSNDALHFLS
ncbi:MAG: hypothetical protein QOG36_1713, partial [Actinomycetota bacterium]|nr:hypothetical protein [Actinomycetota bacterium]